MSEEQLNELTADKAMQDAFKYWVEVNRLSLSCTFKVQREKYFKLFKSAFLDGVTAHANGNYY